MSKLAAICAKLQGGAVAVSDTTSSLSLFDSPQGTEDSQALFPLPNHVPEPCDEPAQSSVPHSPGPMTPTVASTDDEEAPTDTAIGVLKRKSIMSSNTGSSRRKRQRPAASTSALDTSVGSDFGQANAEDNASMDGSEHSLHIDLPDDQIKGGAGISRNRSPFQQYGLSSNSSLPNQGAADFPPSSASFGSDMASQSLAALAQQASSFKSEEHNNSRVASPASMSGDSLNDSHGRSSKLGSGAASKQKKPLDHSKYLTRYSNAQDCGFSYCTGMNYREHFHCLDCPSRIIVKKEEMIRHFKWHKKREDSLQHGFMRYSPFDDCSVKFGPCAHNNKQTHYHCIQTGCNKVYVSTSDVQMHANYHRKASAIIMEGFQRFRATEDCGTPNCDFYSQRTTHFHCRRPACNFTFKNKADMEKHKTYHQKDEILAKDGFKKYMKYEHCPYNGCAYSKLSNHIHCMRPGCQYVLHSTSQLYPHKRKHEKKESDHSANSSFTNFAVAEAMQQTLNGTAALAAQYSSPSTPNSAKVDPQQLASATTASDLLSTVARLSQGLIMSGMKEGKAPPMNPFSSNSSISMPTLSSASTQQDIATATSNDEEPISDSVSETSNEQIFDKSLNLTPGRILEPAAMNWKTEKSSRLSNQAKSMMGHFKISSSNPGESTSKGGADKDSSARNGEKQSELWKKYLTRYTANDPCNPRCWLLYKDHYHCNVERCFNAFKNKDGVRDHARLHDNQEKISEQLFTSYAEGQQCGVEGCQYSSTTTHFHCKWMGCTKTIPLDDDIFARLDHFQEHEFASRVNQATTKRGSHISSAKSINRKRGRPPKNFSAYPGMLSEEKAYAESKPFNTQLKDSQASYSKYSVSRPCYDELCKFRQETHYHCNGHRCHTSTNRLDVMHAHSVNFHNYITIPENYAYFDRNVNCKGVHCSNNRNSCHYHCLRPGCDHSFIRHATVAQHDKRHREDDFHSKLPPKPPLLRLGVPSTTTHNGGLESPLSESYGPRGVGLPTDIHNMAEAVRVKQEAGPRALDRVDDALISKTVKASGTFFPQTGKSDVSADGETRDDSSDASSNAGESHSKRPVAVGAPPMPPSVSAMMEGMGQQNTQATAMFNMLTQMLMIHQKTIAAAQLQQLQAQQHQKSQGQTTSAQDDTWQRMLGRMYASPDLPCSNVFCKKKQFEHYHCLECGTAFNKTNDVGLKVHMSKHRKYASKLGTSGSMDTSSINNGVLGSTANQTVGASQQSQPDTMAGLNAMLIEAMAAQQQQQSDGRNTSAGATASSSAVPTARVADVPDSSTDGNTTPTTSSNNVQEMMMKALQLQMISNSSSEEANSTSRNNPNNDPSDREEGESSAADSVADDDASAASVSDGMYRKYSKSKDCGYAKCVHCKTSDHYHCVREECTYSVVEESRLPQHTKRHEKLDKIMGDDFKLYKQRSECGRADCEFSSKSSHFHCLLCPYICTDANRIMPHRKNHGGTAALPGNNHSCIQSNSATDSLAQEAV